MAQATDYLQTLGNGISPSGWPLQKAKWLLPLLMFLTLSCAAHAQTRGTTGSDFIWSATNSQIMITGYSGTGDAVSIPSMINGMRVTGIGYKAFSKDTHLTSVTIPDSIFFIDNSAFAGCSLTSVTIPSSVHRIGRIVWESGEVFRGCAELASITVDSSNPSFSSADGVLFDKNQTTLIKYPSCKTGSYIIPNSVTIIGDGAFEGCSELTGVTIPDSVTYIGKSAFYRCQRLDSVTIPCGVTSIMDRTFTGCRNLANVTIPQSVTSIGAGAFSLCWSLTNITIPQSVINIEAGAFSCSSLTSVMIPNSVTSIGVGAFTECLKLKDVAFMGNDPTNGLGIFEGNPPGFTVYYFNGARGFTSPSWRGYPAVNMGLPTQTGSLHLSISPAGALNAGAQWQLDGNGTWLGSGVLVSNLPTGLHTLSFKTVSGWVSPNNLIVPIIAGKMTQASGTYTPLFHYTNAFGRITITGCSETVGAVCIPSTIPGVSGTVTSIGIGAFHAPYARNITSITIPASVTSIGFEAFTHCTNLTVITVDANNPAFSSVDGVLFDKNQTTLIKYPAKRYDNSYKIPDTVTSIADSAFNGCHSLNSVTIPSGVTSIKQYTFHGCGNLTSVTFPTNLTSIGEWAFSGCTNLTSVTIPESVISIESQAFSGCGLTSITISNSITRIGSYAFNNCKHLTSVTIPSSVTRINKEAFSNCTNLTSATFMGDAPTMDKLRGGVFDNTASGFTVYYNNGAKGFSSPTWKGYPSAKITASKSVPSMP